MRISPAANTAPGAGAVVLMLWFILRWNLLTALLESSPDFVKIYQLSAFKAAMHLLDATCMLAVARWFSRARTVLDWLKDCGVFVDKFPLRTEAPFVLHAAAVGFGLFFIPWAIFTRPSSFEEAVDTRSIPDRLSVLLTPAAEEVALRGFLYSAWRRNHSIPVSILLTMAPVVVIHWSVCIESLFKAAMIVSVNVCFCLYRESCRSLWPSIVCHTSYNACGVVLSSMTRS